MLGLVYMASEACANALRQPEVFAANGFMEKRRLFEDHRAKSLFTHAHLDSVRLQVEDQSSEGKRAGEANSYVGLASFGAAGLVLYQALFPAGMLCTRFVRH